MDRCKLSVNYNWSGFEWNGWWIGYCNLIVSLQQALHIVRLINIIKHSSLNPFQYWRHPHNISGYKHEVNSQASGRCGSDCRKIIPNTCFGFSSACEVALKLYTIEPYNDKSILVGSDNGWVPSGNKPIHEPKCTRNFVTMWCHFATMGAALFPICRYDCASWRHDMDTLFVSLSLYRWLQLLQVSSPHKGQALRSFRVLLH